METIAIVKLATGSEYPITQETYNQIQEASSEDFIQIKSGTAFKKSAIMEITGKEDFETQKTDWDYHQPYPVLPALGFKGIISREKRLKGIELLAKGIQKAIDNRKPLESPNAEQLLQFARERYSKVKKELAV